MHPRMFLLLLLHEEAIRCRYKAAEEMRQLKNGELSIVIQHIRDGITIATLPVDIITAVGEIMDA